MKKVAVLPNQSIYDFCLQEYGTLEMIPQLQRDNDLELDIPLAGRLLIGRVESSRVVVMYQRLKINVVSNHYLPKTREVSDVNITINRNNDGEVESVTFDASTVGDVTSQYDWSFTSGDFSGAIVTVPVAEENSTIGNFKLYVDGLLIRQRF